MFRWIQSNVFVYKSHNIYSFVYLFIKRRRFKLLFSHLCSHRIQCNVFSYVVNHIIFIHLFIYSIKRRRFNTLDSHMFIMDTMQCFCLYLYLSHNLFMYLFVYKTPTIQTLDSHMFRWIQSNVICLFIYSFIYLFIHLFIYLFTR